MVTPTDLSELSLGSTMKTDFPDPDDILNFTLTIEPDEGMYKNGTLMERSARSVSPPKLGVDPTSCRSQVRACRM